MCRYFEAIRRKFLLRSEGLLKEDSEDRAQSVPMSCTCHSHSVPKKSVPPKPNRSLRQMSDQIDELIRLNQSPTTKVLNEFMSEILEHLLHGLYETVEFLNDNIPSFIRSFHRATGIQIRSLQAQLNHVLSHRPTPPPTTIEIVSEVLKKLEEEKLDKKEDACDAIGRSVADKLRKLSEDQRKQVERLIFQAFSQMEVHYL